MQQFRYDLPVITHRRIGGTQGEIFESKKLVHKFVSWWRLAYFIAQLKNSNEWKNSELLDNIPLRV